MSLTHVFSVPSVALRFNGLVSVPRIAKLGLAQRRKVAEVAFEKNVLICVHPCRSVAKSIEEQGRMS